MTRAEQVAIVLAGGEPAEPHLRALIPDADLVVAADSGLHQAVELGLRVDVVVGDLDSAKPSAVDAAIAAGAEIERHPVDKDATDLELALAAAVARGAAHVTVVGGGGGRLDHFLANAGVLAASRFAAVDVEGLFGGARVAVVRGGRPPHAIRGAPGSLVTLLPVHGDARGVTTTGLEYPLAREDLAAGTTRGVSNVVRDAGATVSLEHGTLLVVQPLGGAQ